MRRISTSAEHRAAGQAHARDSGTAQPRRFPGIDLALLPVNGLAIRPAFNLQVVMSAEGASEFCAVLWPAVAVPTHYAFTADPVGDRLFPKYNGTPERFQRAAARHAPATSVQVLAPGEPFRLPGPVPQQDARRPGTGR